MLARRRNGTRTVLLWGEEDHDQRDHFLREKGATGQIVVGKSLRAIFAHFPQFMGRVDPKGTAAFDLPKFLEALRRLKAARPCPPKVCRLILSSWNIIEDLAYTLRTQSLSKIQHRKRTRTVYEKFFYGNNFPSVTPEGREYWPIFYAKEIELVNRAIHTMLSEISKKDQIIYGLIFHKPPARS